MFHKDYNSLKEPSVDRVYQMLDEGNQNIFRDGHWHANNNSLYTDSVYNDAGYSTDEVNKSRLSEWAFEEYNLYIAVDAYSIIDLLQTIINQRLMITSIS
jgi:hypothetical protein